MPSLLGKELGQLQGTRLDILIELVLVVGVIGRDAYQHLVEEDS